jgi:hypothetical protein
MNPKTLRDIVAEKPFPDYQQWWTMGETFCRLMADAIVTEWDAIDGDEEYPTPIDAVYDDVREYLWEVYQHEMWKTKRWLVNAFVDRFHLSSSCYEEQQILPIQSGEFDALSYGFFLTAFTALAQHEEYGLLDVPLETARRQFTQRVGKQFYEALHNYLNLELPKTLRYKEDFLLLKQSIERVGQFMVTQGYLRDHFRFTFNVEVEYKGETIQQTEAQFIEHLHQNGVGYALYEMGYPVILPSAVYLYNTMGEAQHHSSRTIEELFARVGFEARETDDFDPTGFPSDLVVELWKIRPSS